MHAELRPALPPHVANICVPISGGCWNKLSIKQSQGSSKRNKPFPSQRIGSDLYPSVTIITQRL